MRTFTPFRNKRQCVIFSLKTYRKRHISHFLSFSMSSARSDHEGQGSGWELSTTAFESHGGFYGLANWDINKSAPADRLILRIREPAEKIRRRRTTKIKMITMALPTGGGVTAHLAGSLCRPEVYFAHARQHSATHWAVIHPHGIFNDHGGTGPVFKVSPKRRCHLQHSWGIVGN